MGSEMCIRDSSYNTPYSDQIVSDTYHWMLGWGLLNEGACDSNLVENRVAAGLATNADD